MATPLKVGVLISGGGTNLQEIIDRILAGTLDAEIVTVISNKENAYGLTRAMNAGIRAIFIDPDAYKHSYEYDKAIARELISSGAKLVVMAGYMRLLGRPVLDVFPDAVINLHPAILPSFMGEHGINDAFEYGVKVSGITVHFADASYDTGPIIAQRVVCIEEDDTLESFEKKIHAEEYKLLPEVIQLIAEGRVRVDGRHVHIDKA